MKIITIEIRPIFIFKTKYSLSVYATAAHLYVQITFENTNLLEATAALLSEKTRNPGFIKDTFNRKNC